MASEEIKESDPIEKEEEKKMDISTEVQVQITTKSAP